MATVFWAVYPSAQADPSASDIIAGTVANAIHGSDAAPSTSGAFAGTAITGLSPATSYKLAAVWSDGANDSLVEVSGAFSTLAGGVSAKPFGLQSLSNSYQPIAASRLNGVLQ